MLPRLALDDTERFRPASDPTDWGLRAKCYIPCGVDIGYESPHNETDYIRYVSWRSSDRINLNRMWQKDGSFILQTTRDIAPGEELWRTEIFLKTAPVIRVCSGCKRNMIQSGNFRLCKPTVSGKMRYRSNCRACENDYAKQNAAKKKRARK